MVRGEHPAVCVGVGTGTWLVVVCGLLEVNCCWVRRSWHWRRMAQLATATLQDVCCCRCHGAGQRPARVWLVLVLPHIVVVELLQSSNLVLLLLLCLARPLLLLLLHSFGLQQHSRSSLASRACIGSILCHSLRTLLPGCQLCKLLHVCCTCHTLCCALTASNLSSMSRFSRSMAHRWRSSASASACAATTQRGCQREQHSAHPQR